MRPGSVIVDLAAEQGGNCELCKPGQVVVESGITIIGLPNLQAKVGVDASQMYSRNMEKLILHVFKEASLTIDLAEEITKGCIIAHHGEVTNPKIADALSTKGAANAERTPLRALHLRAGGLPRPPRHREGARLCSTPR